MKPSAGRPTVDQHDLDFCQGLRSAAWLREGGPGSLRRARADDLPALLQLEGQAFEDWRRDPPRVVRESLAHPKREVWVFSPGPSGPPCAALFLRWSSRGLRLYSLATDQSYRGQGLGALLVGHAVKRMGELGLPQLTLEADADQPALVAWYEKLGFTKGTLLKNFYGEGKGAWRFHFPPSAQKDAHS